VVAELVHETERLAAVADDAGPERWGCGLTVGGSRSDVRRMLEHALHDSSHHVLDVELGLARLRSTAT